MRPLALGRKNWLHVGSEAAGPKIAAILSIMETCKRLQINLRKYLNDVLPKLPSWPINNVAALSPLQLEILQVGSPSSTDLTGSVIPPHSWRCLRGYLSPIPARRSTDTRFRPLGGHTSAGRKAAKRARCHGITCPCRPATRRALLPIPSDALPHSAGWQPVPANADYLDRMAARLGHSTLYAASGRRAVAVA